MSRERNRKTTGSDLLDEIEALRNKANQLESEFLKEAGWKYTCNTPGSYWLWKKPISEGTSIVVDQATAMRIQVDEDLG